MSLDINRPVFDGDARRGGGVRYARRGVMSGESRPAVRRVWYIVYSLASGDLRPGPHCSQHIG